jgi:predicted ABC-type exoprotein transport system permease subunit
MKWAALVTWVLTAGGGFFLLGLWLKHGGMEQSEQPGQRIRAARVLSHFALAATGLVLWILFVATDSTALAWIAFVILLAVALLGFSMLALWLGQRRVRAEASAAGPGAAPPAEQHFPVATVALHGLLAATTLVLVLIAAAGS